MVTLFLKEFISGYIRERRRLKLKYYLQTEFGNFVISSKVTCRPHFPIKEENNIWVRGGYIMDFLLSVENRK